MVRSFAVSTRLKLSFALADCARPFAFCHPIHERRKSFAWAATECRSVYQQLLDFYRRPRARARAWMFTDETDRVIGVTVHPRSRSERERGNSRGNKAGCAVFPFILSFIWPAVVASGSAKQKKTRYRIKNIFIFSPLFGNIDRIQRSK